MVHGYHVILPCYGFWLPNDPRGSWSDFVHRWELTHFGKSTRHLEQRTLAHLSETELAQREAARAALKYPPVCLSGHQALAIAQGFAQQAAKSRYTIWALAILPEHTHMVIARHHYKVEQVTWWRIPSKKANPVNIGAGWHRTLASKSTAPTFKAIQRMFNPIPQGRLFRKQPPLRDRVKHQILQLSNQPAQYILVPRKNDLAIGWLVAGLFRLPVWNS